MTKENFTANDKKFMKLALKLAEKGSGTVSPNPMVGAVITENDIFVSGGFHAAAGYNHAEINAIENAKNKFGGRLPAGLKMYVTLEPCSIHGKTPPCTDALISNKFSEIIISTLDPNPKINGNGFLKLKQAGLTVKSGLFQEQAVKLNEIFFTNIFKKRPFVCAKTASTLDGNLAAKTGDSKWITGKKSRKLVQQFRFDYGCVLTGINTVKKDDPFLYPRKISAGRTTRIKEGDNFENIEKTFLKKIIKVTGKDGKPVKKDFFNFTRAIVDSRFDIDINSNITRTSRFVKTVIFTCSESIQKREEKYRLLLEKGIFIEPVSSVKNYSGKTVQKNKDDREEFFKKKKTRLDLNEVLKTLFKKYEITSVMLECGPGLLTSFLKAGLIDKFLFFIAPKIIGGENPYCIFKELGLNKMSESIDLRFEKIKRIKNDLLIEAYPCLQE